MHSFDRLYVVRKFILPTLNDLTFLSLNFDEKCDYLNEDLSNNHYWREYINNLNIYCEKIVPFIDFYKNQIFSYNCTSHTILNEISLMLPSYSKGRKEKRDIITLLITSFIGLMYEGISSYLHNWRQKALHKTS